MASFIIASAFHGTSISIVRADQTIARLANTRWFCDKHSSAEGVGKYMQRSRLNSPCFIGSIKEFYNDNDCNRMFLYLSRRLDILLPYFL